MDPINVLRDFSELQRFADVSHDKILLIRFIQEHFDEPGSELESCDPEDWVPSPGSFRTIKSYRLRRWALHLNRLWKDLCRRVKDDVRINQNRYSLLYVPNNFIIPGGRFREFYYWDSYWIMKGLLFSEMYLTAKNMIKNLGFMVDNYGFVPNGGRVYYMTRSHPPLLTPMVYDYYIATGDIDFVNSMLPTLEKEYNFWLSNRNRGLMRSQSSIRYFQYRASMKSPRPESYREDYELAANLSAEAREMVWSNIASAAETGWDFSTRWFAQNGPQKHYMQSIRTWSIIPVDLNAFMCMNTRQLASLYEITGDRNRESLYRSRYKQIQQAIHDIHWNETDGIWYDFDIDENAHVKQYYLSNVLPLFAKCYDKDATPQRVYNYLKREGATNFTKGVPTSGVNSGQQWDSVNAWPPLVHMTIEGFRTSGDPKMAVVAKEMAEQWLRSNYKAFIHSHAMYEKYNVTESSQSFAGSGGEYEVQTGFGWTNGVILDLLSHYGDQISVSGAGKLGFTGFSALLWVVCNFHNEGFGAKHVAWLLCLVYYWRQF